MSASITLENIDATLLRKTIQTGKELTYDDAAQMIQPLIDLLGMDSEKKAIIDGIAHLKGEYPIDAEDMLKSLGALSEDARAGEVKRMLERARIIPKGQKFKAMSADIASNNELFVAYSNQKCQVIHLTEKRENGKTYYPIKYKLTINAAHKVLMRAYNDDTFADYFSIQLQLIAKYQKYQSDYKAYIAEEKAKRLRMASELQNQFNGNACDKIDRLEATIKNMNHSHSAKIDELLRRQEELLGHAEETSKDLKEARIDIKEMNEKLDGMFDFMTGLARFALPMWNGASVFKTQLEHLIQGKTLSYALKHLKVMFVVAFYNIEDDHSDVLIYFCCTNFADVRDRIVKLYKRHVEDADDPMIMLKPAAICLISQEINCERSNLSQLNLNDTAHFNERTKSFGITYESKKHKDVRINYKAIVENVRQVDWQGYQMRRSKIEKDESYSINHDIISRLTKADKHFYVETQPFCCEYINYQTTKINKKKLSLGYEPRDVNSLKKLTSKKFDYEDLDMRLTKTMYPLYKINDILIKDNGVNQIDAMIEDGIISKSNVKSLFRTAKAAAKAEDVEFDDAMQEQVDAINEDDLPDTDDEDF